MELGFGIFRLNYWFLVEVGFFLGGIILCCVIEDKMELGFGIFRLLGFFF